MKDFESFSKILGSIASSLMDSIVLKELSPEELSYINAKDADFFKKKIEVVGLGTNLYPERLVQDTCASGALDIVEYEELYGIDVIPKHYMINDKRSKGNNVEVSWELPPDFHYGYYMSPALISEVRSNSRKRFEKNVITFENEEIVYFEFSPDSNSFEISIREAQKPGQTILDIECNMYDFDIPQNESDIPAVSASTGLSKEYYELFWNLKYKKYGRRKFPKFSLNLQQLDLDALYNLYK